MTKLLREDSKIELAEFQSASFKSFLDRSRERRCRDGAERHFNAGEIVSFPLLCDSNDDYPESWCHDIT